MPEESVDPVVVDRRIRRAQMDWLDMVLTLETDPPPFDLNEVINQWFDWNPDVPVADDYPSTTYTASEAERLVAVGIAMNRLCEATPKTITDEAAATATPEWRELHAAVERAMAEMLILGHLPGDDQDAARGGLHGENGVRTG